MGSLANGAETIQDIGMAAKVPAVSHRYVMLTGATLRLLLIPLFLFNHRGLASFRNCYFSSLNFLYLLNFDIDRIDIMIVLP